MSKYLLVFGLGLILTSCGGYTDEQSKAADEFCGCMEKEGDFDILWLECDMEISSKYNKEIFADEGWSLALEEKCPSVAGKIADGE